MNSRSNNAAPFEPEIHVFLQNCTAFSGRFPELAVLLGLDSGRKALRCLEALPPQYRLVQTKAGGMKDNPALVIGENALHSRYNPKEEARRILLSDFFMQPAVKQRCVFAGLGLGYLPVQYAAANPSAQAVIIEPDIHTFLCFLAAGPLTAFFRHEQLTLLIGVRPDEAASFLNSQGLNDSCLFKHTASLAVQKDWFDAFFTLRERTNTKNSVNAKTLERFGKLWLKNTVTNMPLLCGTAKIRCFHNAFSHVPALVLAGGPSLTRHLLLIKKTKQNYLIIAVDTAVRACIQEGIVPDFILSFDPQYWNYLHTAGLDTSQSILISEAAVFPAVLRQQYRALFLSNSSVPFAQFLEQDCDADNTLAAGGSVATTAWDFARYTGANPIFMAGLDLAFPNKQTHFAGSTFEEAAHTVSMRLHPAEQTGCRALYSAFPAPHQDYKGGTVITDRRMLMYAWWFESTLVKHPGIKTYNFMPAGIMIPGMPPCTEEDLFRLAPEGMPRTAVQERLRRIIDQAYSETFFAGIPQRRQQLRNAVQAMKESAADLMRQAEQAEELCRYLAENTGNAAAGGHIRKDTAVLFERLNGIDTAIRTGFAKKLVEVLFCSTESVQPEHGNGQDPSADPFIHAEKVYRRIRGTAQQVYEALKAADTGTFL